MVVQSWHVAKLDVVNFSEVVTDIILKINIVCLQVSIFISFHIQLEVVFCPSNLSKTHKLQN